MASVAAAAEGLQRSRRIAVGRRTDSDVGMIFGGGSKRSVDPIGGNALKPFGRWPDATGWGGDPVPDVAPGGKIQARVPHATVKSTRGHRSGRAAKAAAKGADVAIVFAYRWESEGMDLPNLSLEKLRKVTVQAVDQHRRDRGSGRGESAHGCGCGVRQPGDHAVGGRSGGDSGSLVRGIGWRECGGQCAVWHDEPQRQVAEYVPEERGRPAAGNDCAATADALERSVAERRAEGAGLRRGPTTKALKVGYRRGMTRGEEGGGSSPSGMACRTPRSATRD